MYFIQQSIEFLMVFKPSSERLRFQKICNFFTRFNEIIGKDNQIKISLQIIDSSFFWCFFIRRVIWCICFLPSQLEISTQISCTYRETHLSLDFACDCKDQYIHLSIAWSNFHDSSLWPFTQLHKHKSPYKTKNDLEIAILIRNCWRFNFHKWSLWRQSFQFHCWLLDNHFHGVTLSLDLGQSGRGAWGLITT